MKKTSLEKESNGIRGEEGEVQYRGNITGGGITGGKEKMKGGGRPLVRKKGLK